MDKTDTPTPPLPKRTKARSFVSNADLDKLVKRIGGLDKTQQDSVYEGLIYVRGTYERKLEEIRQALKSAVR